MFWKLSSFQRHTANQYLLTYELPRASFWGPLRRPRAPYSCLTDCFIFQHSDRHQRASCNTHLTVRHLLLHSGEFNSQRQPLIAYCRIQNIGIGTATLLEHANLPHLSSIFLGRLVLLPDCRKQSYANHSTKLIERHEMVRMGRSAKTNKRKQKSSICATAMICKCPAEILIPPHMILNR